MVENEQHNKKLHLTYIYTHSQAFKIFVPFQWGERGRKMRVHSRWTVPGNFFKAYMAKSYVIQ